MSETFAETQVRLHLERETASAFMALIEQRLVRCPVTVIAFDYGDGRAEPFQSVAYKTSLDKRALIRTAEALLRSWSLKTPRVVSYLLAERIGLPETDRVIECKDVVRARLRESVGFAILFGVGEVLSYIATGDRDGVRELLETELLPNWRRELG